MFFIGGFNSVIPYVVYLSLIWTFMILSFGDKIAAILHKQSDKEIASSKVISIEGDNHYLNCYHYDSVKQSHNETAGDVPLDSPFSRSTWLIRHLSIRTVSPPLPSAEPYSFLFRGPPLVS